MRRPCRLAAGFAKRMRAVRAVRGDADDAAGGLREADRFTYAGAPAQAVRARASAQVASRGKWFLYPGRHPVGV